MKEVIKVIVGRTMIRLVVFWAVELRIIELCIGLPSGVSFSCVVVLCIGL